MIDGSQSICFLSHSIVDYVKKWGNSTSIALLDPSCCIFSNSSIEGVIGYREEGNSMIVFGDPVCSYDNMVSLAIKFHEYCSMQGKNIVYVASSSFFLNSILEYHKYIAIEIGDEIILNPCIDLLNKKGKYPSLLRNKYNQLERSNITIHEYIGEDLALEEQMKNCAKTWSNNRKGPQVYLLQIDLFKDRENKRWFYAKDGDEVVGVIMLNRVDSNDGWILNILMILPKAPAYLSECIVLHVLNVLRNEECSYLSIGFLPSMEFGDIKGLNMLYIWAAKLIYKVCKKMFNLQDRQRYWRKFYPNKKSAYIVFSTPYLSLKSIISLMKGLNVNIDK